MYILTGFSYNMKTVSTKKIFVSDFICKALCFKGMGLKYTKRAMTSYEVHRFFHGLEVSFSQTLFDAERTILRSHISINVVSHSF